MQNIFVDNPADDTSQQILRAAFEAFGQVLTVKLVRDRDTAVPRGFAFIEMALMRKQAGSPAIQGSEGRPEPKDSKGTGLEMRRHREHRY